MAVGAWQCRNGWPISSDLLALVPQAHTDPVRTLAQDRMQEPLTQQLVALVGAPERTVALAIARDLATRWRDSDLFQSVETDVAVDLDAVRHQLLAGRIAMLPDTDQTRLLDDPIAFLTDRARELADPFSSSGTVPVDQDWIGLTRRIEHGIAPPGQVRFDITSGTLQAESQGKTWILIRMRIKGSTFDPVAPQAVAAQIESAEQAARAQGGELLAAGGPLFAASGRAQAMQESAWIGGVSILGIVLVLLLAYRRWRVLFAFAPVAVGMLAGAVTCVAIFGSIHVMTLVMGVTLIGVAIDFPMHWLGKSFGLNNWAPWPVLHKVLPGLTISLGAALVGYLALAFTPFPALTQTAVFSAAGLLGAYLCTVCQLPNVFRNWKPRPWPALLGVANGALALQQRFARQRGRWLIMLTAAALCAGGIFRLNLHDDLRQWINLPPVLLQQARQIGEITGFMPTSQFLLVRADDTDTLISRQHDVSRRLDTLVDQGVIDGYTSLSQLVRSQASQRRLQQALAGLADRSDVWRPLVDIGIPLASIKTGVLALATLPPVDLETALTGPLGERWRGLWLGRVDAEVAGTITFQGLHDTARLNAILGPDLPGVTLVDRSGELNRAFSETRFAAATLKVLSYIAAAALLWLTLGRRATVHILAVPIAATACSLAALGYLGQPLTLFSLFGLLLVSAIGVDYAIFMYERIAGTAASLVGILLAASTTLLSFGMLAVSRTPALSNFGLSVALGITFSVLFAPWVPPQPPRPNHPSPLP